MDHKTFFEPFMQRITRQYSTLTQRRKQFCAGFTLLETVVAVMILSFAILGPFALAAQSLRVSRDARQELVATQLAEEGIEAVHNMRDNASADDITIDQSQWMQNIVSKCPVNCVIDMTARASGPIVPGANNVWTLSSLIDCSVACDTKMYFNPTTLIYRQSSSALGSPWQPTVYSRTITITGIDNVLSPKRQVRVTATVTFRGYGKALKTVTISDDLYNWFTPLH